MIVIYMNNITKVNTIYTKNVNYCIYINYCMLYILRFNIENVGFKSYLKQNFSEVL